MDTTTPVTLPSGALDPTLTFMRALWRLEHALEKASKQMEDTHGVTGPQRLALRIIGVVPDIGPAALAAALHLHPSTITGILQRLETRGLLTRLRHASDGRRMHLRVTRAGARLNAPAAPGTVEQAVRLALARVPVREREATLAVLDRLATALTRSAGHGRTPDGPARTTGRSIPQPQPGRRPPAPPGGAGGRRADAAGTRRRG